MTSNFSPVCVNAIGSLFTSTLENALPQFVLRMSTTPAFWSAVALLET